MSFRNLFVLTFVFFFAGTASAQTSSVKIGVINSLVFAEEKAGITKFVTANNQLITEFRPVQSELETMSKRLQTLSVEIENLQKQPNPDVKLIQAKADEGEQLRRNLGYKTEDAKERYSRRERQVLGPVMDAIGKGLQEYAKTKGYSLIFDAAKDQNGLLVAIGDQGLDVTKDFIAFYNAKP